MKKQLSGVIMSKDMSMHTVSVAAIIDFVLSFLVAILDFS